MRTNVLAMYLPQFHRVPENDEWWGEGYTEWTATKGAEKIFDGHNQPRVPLDKNYYDLLEYGTMAWQAELMKKYRIDGMCMYHYWFEKGRRILEKPAENLLKWTDISMPFCFCWANAAWVRTWKKMSYGSGSTWSDIYETKCNSGENGILLKQCYGREKDWDEHFRYLLPFFKDERYIKQNGKPVFVIHQPRDIHSLWSMINYFNKRARENDLPGVYFIGMEREKYMGLDAICPIMPANAPAECYEQNNSYNDLEMYSYDKFWEIMIKQRVKKDNKTFLCGMVDYDDTPRRGKKGIIFGGASPEKFYKYFKKLYKKSFLLDNEFVFINAWNEWGEGMYLEPDEKNRYGYLESVSRVVMECEKELLSKEKAGTEKLYETKSEKRIRMKEEETKILRKYGTLLEHWLCLREKNVDFSRYFKKYGYQKIAIYGMGKLGTHLFYELSEGDIEVCFGIDRNGPNAKYPIKVYSPEQQMPNVDAVVITVTNEYGKIGESLNENMKCPMIAIEELVQELWIDD